MSKSRFKGRRPALKPEWILDGSSSTSVTPTTTSIDELYSRPTSSIEQQTAASTHGNENGSEPEEIQDQGFNTHQANNPSLTVSQEQPSQSSGAKTKSRYSKFHTSDWTVSSATNDGDVQSDSQEKRSKLKMWTRQFMGEKMSTHKPINAPSPNSTVPPAPTQPTFPEEDVPPSLKRRDHGEGPHTQSPSSCGDVPARVPYIASNYTPTCSPAY